MSLIKTYLAKVQAQRDAAAKTPLSRRKAVQGRSVGTWKEIACGLSDTAARAAINLAAKSARIG